MKITQLLEYFVNSHNVVVSFFFVCATYASEK